MLNPIQWWKNYKLMCIQTTGLLIAMESMDIQLCHLEALMKQAENSNNEVNYANRKGSVHTLKYWRGVMQEIYDGTYLKTDK